MKLLSTIQNDEGNKNKELEIPVYLYVLVKPEDQVNDSDVPKAPSSGVLYRA